MVWSTIETCFSSVLWNWVCWFLVLLSHFVSSALGLCCAVLCSRGQVPPPPTHTHLFASFVCSLLLLWPHSAQPTGELQFPSCHRRAFRAAVGRSRCSPWAAWSCRWGRVHFVPDGSFLPGSVIWGDWHLWTSALPVGTTTVTHPRVFCKQVFTV